MPDTDSQQETLIEHLVADLRPVRPLSSPWIQATCWLAGVLVLALVFASFADPASIKRRLASEPDMWLAVLGSSLTAVLAAYAAFLLTFPDRSRLWALLPTPGLVLWVLASGLGCARTWLAPRPEGALVDEMRHCLMFIVAVSLPLSLVMFVMLRRGFSMSPSLTSAAAGLAVAAAAATLLNFFHPFDAAFDDLAVHAVAVALVVVATRALGMAVLSRPIRNN